MTFPNDFIHRMNTLLGDDAQEFFEGYRLPLRRGLRVNTRKCDVTHFQEIFPHPLTPSPFAPNAFYLDTPHKAGADPLHHAGAYYMQEPSASSAVTVLAPQHGEHVLDLCAAPGGKSTQIAEAIGDTGFLWCNEYVRARSQILAQNLERLGVRNVIVSNSDTTPLCEQLEGCFDAVLADVPCSGEGMFRKEDVALTQWSTELVQECAERGRDILHNASLAVRPGGRLVYSTCTFAPEENELQIAHFLETHPEFVLADCNVTFGRPGLSPRILRRFDPTVSEELPLERCRRIFPSDGGEGHFIALLLRTGDAPRRTVSVKPTRPAKSNTDVIGFWTSCFKDVPSGEFAVWKEAVRLIPNGAPTAKGIPLVYAGCPIGTIAKNRIEPHHAAFISASTTDCVRCIDLPLNDHRIMAFLHGEEIAVDPSLKGFTAVAVSGIVCGFGKAVGGTLKNRYPKGLRIL